MGRELNAAIAEYIATSQKVIAKLVEKGDVSGHEFHGNRWTGGLGSAGSLSGRAAVQSHIDYMMEMDHANIALDLMKKTGGFTYDPAEHKFTGVGDKGFAVSPYPERAAVFTRPMTVQDIKDYITKNADLLGRPGHNIGGWDDENGKQILDVAIIVHDKTEAVNLAHQFSQDAIFDFAAGQSIATKSAPGEKGDVVGHTFHGNRFTGGLGGAGVQAAARHTVANLPANQREKTLPEALAQGTKLGGPVEAAKVRQNLRSVLASATPAEIQEGKNWYPSVHERCAGWSAKYGVPIEVAAAAIAATSPNCAWDQNLKIAENALAVANSPVVPPLDDAWKAKLEAGNVPKDDWPKPGQAMKDINARALALAPFSKGLSNGIGKAIEMARGEPIEDVLKGPKVNSFIDNIAHPESSQEVTVDIHAERVALGRLPQTATDDKDMGLLLNRAGVYNFLADQYREIAQTVHMSPLELQAVTWVTWKHDTDAQFRALARTEAFKNN
jgi:hypothetical protein